MSDPGFLFQLSFLPVLPTLVAALRSVVTYCALLGYIVLAAPPGLLLAVVFRSQRSLYALGHLGIRLGLGLAGIRFRVAGRARVPPPTMPVVFCSNHESNIDPPVLFRALHPRVHLVYKAELHKLPVMGTVFDVGGFVGVDRANREGAIASIRRGSEQLRRGDSFLIFPEGTRSRTGDLLPFKKGGFVMAIEAQVPVVPVAVSGGRAAMRKGSAVVRPVTVSIRVGAPIPTKGMSIGDRDRLIESVRAEVRRLLDEGPVAEGPCLF